MRILLVEDDPEQLEPLHAALSRSGHIVDAVEDGATARWLLGEKEYDMLIIDWMLPDEDGIFLCRDYRKAGKTAPVLITRPDGSLVVNNPIEEDYGYEYEDDWDDWYEYPVAESYGSISGTIQAVAGNEFLLNSDNGPVFVDGGPSWYQPLNLLAGEQVTVSGEYDDEDFDAFRITRSNGEVISIRDEAGPPPWAGAWK